MSNFQSFDLTRNKIICPCPFAFWKNKIPKNIGSAAKIPQSFGAAQVEHHMFTAALQLHKVKNTINLSRLVGFLLDSKDVAL